MSDFSSEEVRVLKALAAGLLGASGANGNGHAAANEAPLADAQLENSWADKEIKKDPPRWSGPSFVGKRYSEASAEWLDSFAGFKEWAAKKGRDEVPVRLKDNGKPWHESDTFEAKLCRAWAKRARERGPVTHAVAVVDDSAADNLPF